jgi:hypothetical protein
MTASAALTQHFAADSQLSTLVCQVGDALRHIFIVYATHHAAAAVRARRA